MASTALNSDAPIRECELTRVTLCLYRRYRADGSIAVAAAGRRSMRRNAAVVLANVSSGSTQTRRTAIAPIRDAAIASRTQYVRNIRLRPSPWGMCLAKEDALFKADTPARQHSHLNVAFAVRARTVIVNLALWQGRLNVGGVK